MTQAQRQHVTLSHPVTVTTELQTRQLQQTFSPAASAHFTTLEGDIFHSFPKQEIEVCFHEQKYDVADTACRPWPLRKIKLELKFLAESSGCLNSFFLIPEILLLTHSLEHKINDLIIHPPEEPFYSSLRKPPDCASWDASSLHSREYWLSQLVKSCGRNWKQIKALIPKWLTRMLRPACSRWHAPSLPRGSWLQDTVFNNICIFW